MLAVRQAVFKTDGGAEPYVFAKTVSRCIMQSKNDPDLLKNKRGVAE